MGSQMEPRDLDRLKQLAATVYLHDHIAAHNADLPEHRERFNVCTSRMCAERREFLDRIGAKS